MYKQKATKTAIAEHSAQKDKNNYKIVIGAQRVKIMVLYRY